jgi:PhnB protein
MQVTPYLFLEGRCEEALDFYRAALGAEVTALMRYRDAPEGPPPAPGMAEKVMHAGFKVGGAEVFCSDGHCSGQPELKGFGLAVTLPDAATVERFMAALAAGGEVRMPATRTFFSPCFGMVADRFGVPWMLMAAG